MIAMKRTQKYKVQLILDHRSISAHLITRVQLNFSNSVDNERKIRDSQSGHELL